jgi:hypothetical protein
MLTIGTVLSIVYTSFGLGVELQSVFHTPSVISLFDEVLSWIVPFELLRPVITTVYTEGDTCWIDEIVPSQAAVQVSAKSAVVILRTASEKVTVKVTESALVVRFAGVLHTIEVTVGLVISIVSSLVLVSILVFHALSVIVAVIEYVHPERAGEIVLFARVHVPAETVAE